ncbi:MAG: tRNA (adenosine(37)-N6)-threonylcarbamoyltransferase complex ATPase subunit type 1 TsaE [Alphaproteobacteria bacterium]|nr:tRNA (adenosine(37)-N6)-threonylcarbamoyltransferase complex ATPase subunit type 1 TsaE [Alphaproteobacteria bacterium]
MPSEHKLPDLAALRALASKIAPLLRTSDCLALYGDLGAGKTEFARALLRARGVAGDVPSPTFTLVQTYDVKGLRISHFDLYRIKLPDELDELGFDDALADGAVIVEWPERAEKRLPADRLELRFSVAADGARLCAIEPRGNWQGRL